MDEIISILLQIANLPLLPYVALSISLAYFGLAGVLFRGEQKKKEAFFEPPPNLF